MRNPNKELPLILTPAERLIRKAALGREFDRAAVNFFLKYNGPLMGLPLKQFLGRFERAIVFETLVRTHGSQKETADLLKVKKQTLNWKVKKQHIRITKQTIKQPA